jgi:hypothetical protein
MFTPLISIITSHDRGLREFSLRVWKNFPSQASKNGGMEPRLLKPKTYPGKMESECGEWT